MLRLLVACLALCLCQLGSAFNAAAVPRLAHSALARAAPVMKTGESVIAQLRKASDEELAQQADEAKAALYDMRHKRATRQTVKTSDYGNVKYKISAINTVLSERAK
ncbi:hypothetical protein KFE25_001258 [Diacronema lutheri]|uniref:RxLR effector protein n=1 Tax=Diacronema lutheri TaxID=2081491 RepID=A0A8J5XEY8_DIALT|nr:hypothetical protein KFE25_001258 [Diacronema lutheri]